MLGLLVFFVPAALAARETAEVRGRVVTLKGEPIAKIGVMAMPRERPIKGRLLPVAWTDEAGEFSFSIQPDRYVISAHDEERGYPRFFFAFFDYGNEAASVTLDLQAGKTETIELRLREAARVAVRVIDDSSGEPVAGAQINARIADSPELQHGYWTHGHDGELVERLLPSDVDLLLEVNAEGYARQDVVQAGDSAVVRFREGQKATFTVRLRRQQAGFASAWASGNGVGPQHAF